MNKQKKNLKTLFENSIFSKAEFYIKFSLIFLLATIFIVIFVLQNGRMFFESYPYTEKFKNNDFQVHVIDVGNGDAMIIKFPNNQTMIIDTGDEYYSNHVTSYVQQYLWSEDLDSIDYLLLTHADSDHVGGAKAIFDKFEVKNLYRPKVYSETEYSNLEAKENYKISKTNIYDEVIMQAYDENCNIIFNEAGISLNLGGCKVEFLSPLNNNYDASNNYSAVIMITYENKKLLFMGDAETSVEEELIKKYGESLKADILKIGHHGSLTSSSEKFLGIVQPEIAILSCSSRDNFPNDIVVKRLSNLNVKMLSTGIRGSFAISIIDENVVYANAEKPTNNLALIFTIFILVAFIIWKNPFKNINHYINKIKND